MAANGEEQGKEKGIPHTVLHSNPTPYPPRRLVDDNIPHAVAFPLPQYMHNLLPCTNAGHLEREDGDGGFDAQEFHQPVLMLGLNLARSGGRGE